MAIAPLTQTLRADFADPPRRTRIRRRAACPRSPLAARAAMRIHEWMMRRRTFALSRQLEECQDWSGARLEQLQWEKFLQLLRLARTSCPFFQSDRYRAADGLRHPYELTSLPLLTRDSLRVAARGMRWPDAPGKILIDHTHGSTDERVAYYWDRNRQAWDKANRLRGHGWHGFSPGDRELHLWPTDPPIDVSGRLKSALRSMRDVVLRERQIDCLRLNSTQAAQFWQEWRGFDPARVTAFPSMLDELISADPIAARGARTDALRSIFLTGEVAFPWQRRRIETTFGVPVVQNYGVQEAGAIAFECERGGWHLCAESILVEFIRDGRAARPGEWAEVVVTGLESRAMPIIRYATGDIVRMAELTCDCGRGLPVMPQVAGRALDFLIADSGDWIEPQRAIEATADLVDNGAMQIRQMAEGSIDVSVAQSSALTIELVTAIRARIGRLVGPRLACCVRPVASLARTEFGKCRFIHSEKARPGLALKFPNAAERIGSANHVNFEHSSGCLK